MTLVDTLEKISKALGIFAWQVQSENLTGMFSKNRLSEDILLPIFQIVFAAPQLRNLNAEQPNSPSIDLADDSSRLAIQISSERSSSKVTDTLDDFLKRQLHKRYDRLIIFVLSNTKCNYTSRTLSRWKALTKNQFTFTPSKDIIAVPNLFPLIQSQPHRQISQLHDIISQTVIGESFIDFETLLLNQSQLQIHSEKESARYIPEVFIEVQRPKDLGRSFTHPTLFFSRTLGSLHRLNTDSCNVFLQRMGLKPMSFPNIDTYRAEHDLRSVPKAASALERAYSGVLESIANYRDAADQPNAIDEINPKCRPFYEENKWTFGWSFGQGLKYRLEEFIDELQLVHKQIFVFTGKAGQGKTNFVCDFVENFLWKHKIPCGYFSGRKLSAIHTGTIEDAINTALFDRKTASFQEAVERLEHLSYRIRKPIILIIDGLNEHHRIQDFSGQLEVMLQKIRNHPYIKFILTCRSEFFRERFAFLTSSEMSKHVLVFEQRPRQIDETHANKLVEGYFKFFNVQIESVADHVIDVLMRDVLLLRFFCETYGARDKPPEYSQPYIGHLYREQMFRRYADTKLNSAAAQLDRIRNKLTPQKSTEDLKRVLTICLQWMLKNQNFGNVPIDIVPKGLEDALYVLLDEDLILRKDVQPKGEGLFRSVFETLNFTFDEFRDFLLAD